MKRIILLLFFISLTSLVRAEGGLTDKLLKYNFHWNQMPMLCGTMQDVTAFVTDNGFTIDNMSVGREGATPKGNAAYVVSVYIKGDTTLTVITNMTATESCIVYQSFDMWYPNRTEA